MFFLPVTSVKILADPNRILSAAGNELRLHDISKRIQLDRVTIDGIKVIHKINVYDDVIIVTGGFCLMICQLVEDKVVYKNYTLQRYNEFVLDCIIYSGSTALCPDEKSKKLRFCVALSHGTTQVFELDLVGDTFKFLAAVVPSNRSLLYCGHLFRAGVLGQGGTEDQSVFLAGGSVQGDIVVWRVVTNDKVEPHSNQLAVLRGHHRGAVFDIFALWDHGLLFSCGDDRSILIWAYHTSSVTSTSNWVVVRAFHGHEARVWGLKPLIETPTKSGSHLSILLASWGEDCSVRVWRAAWTDRTRDNIEKIECNAINNIDGNDYAFVFEPHTGRSVWTGDMVEISARTDDISQNTRFTDHNVRIVTGGNDGGIVVTELTVPEAPNMDSVELQMQSSMESSLVTTNSCRNATRLCLRLPDENVDSEINSYQSSSSFGRHDFPRRVLVLSQSRQCSEISEILAGYSISTPAIVTETARIYTDTVVLSKKLKPAVVVVTDRGCVYISDLFEGPDQTQSIRWKLTQISSDLLQGYCVLYQHQYNCRHSSTCGSSTLIFGTMSGSLIVASVVMDNSGVLSSLSTTQILSTDYTETTEPGSRKVMAIDRACNHGQHPTDYESDEDNDLIVSMSDGRLILMQLETQTVCHTYRLQYHYARVPTPNKTKSGSDGSWAVCWTRFTSDTGDQRLVIGDRLGRLHQFSLRPVNINDTVSNTDNSSKNSVVIASMKFGNKSCGVTCIVWHARASRLFIGTKAGEIYSLDENLNSLVLVFKNPDMIGWVCRISLDPNSEDDDDDQQFPTNSVLTVTGFKSVAFRRLLVHTNGAQSVLMLEEECGGGHRDWDYIENNGQSVLVFIQAGAVKTVSWVNQSNKSIVIQQPLHGKEINCCLVIEHSTQRLVLLTGSEDCALGLVSIQLHASSIESCSKDINRGQCSLSGIQRIHGHISSVRCAELVRPDLLVSAGGRAQLIFWQRDTMTNSLRELNTVLLSRYMHSSGTSSDTRIMALCSLTPYSIRVDSSDGDILVGIACSCGSLLAVSLRDASSKPRLEYKYRLADSCLTGLDQLHSVIIASCTDGHIYWVPVEHIQKEKVPSIDNHGIRRHLVAKCALQGMDTFTDQNSRIAVSVGGDDGSVAILQLKRDVSDSSNGWLITEQSRRALAHAGCTVATRWLPSDTQIWRLVSLGSDGCLLLWDVTEIGPLMTLRPLRCLTSALSLTDPHAMTVSRDRQSPTRYWLFLVGMGASLISIDL